MTNCPNCGAPAAGSRCEYCGTPLERETVAYYADNRIVELDVQETENLEAVASRVRLLTANLRRIPAREAAEAFRRLSAADGIVGPDTWGRLLKGQTERR